MKLNSGGLKLCAVYLAFAATMIAMSYFTHDPKGKFFLGSLAWSPAGITFGILQLFPLLYRHPWTNTPFLFCPVCLDCGRLIGWALSAIKSYFS